MVFDIVSSCSNQRQSRGGHGRSRPVTAGHGRSRPVTAKGSGLWRLYEAVAVGVSEFFELLERTRL